MDDLARAALVPVVLGAVFVVVGVRIGLGVRAFRRVAVRVPGVVTDLVWSPGSGDSSGTWYPVLSFTTAQGQLVETRGMFGRSPAPARRGQQVQVLYDPADPRRADIPRSGGGCLAVVFVVLGLLALTIGVVLLVASRR